MLNVWLFGVSGHGCTCNCLAAVVQDLTTKIEQTCPLDSASLEVRPWKHVLRFWEDLTVFRRQIAALTKLGHLVNAEVHLSLCDRAFLSWTAWYLQGLIEKGLSLYIENHQQLRSLRQLLQEQGIDVQDLSRTNEEAVKHNEHRTTCPSDDSQVVTEVRNNI